jgi:hypothetical protein
MDSNSFDLHIRCSTFAARPMMEQQMMPFYKVRHLAGEFEELPCLQQLEDECAAMYFNVIYGAKVRRRFTTEKISKRCEDYVLVAQEDAAAAGLVEEREIPLFDLS